MMAPAESWRLDGGEMKGQRVAHLCLTPGKGKGRGTGASDGRVKWMD